MNYECAIAADRKIGMLPGYEVSAPLPVMLLVAFSIELSLKSRLLRAKVPKAKLRNKYGHNLLKMLCDLETHIGPTDLSNDDRCTLELIRDLHSKDFYLRYYESPVDTGTKYPVFGPLDALARKCLELCYAPSINAIRVR